MQYGTTQVCVVDVTRSEIEAMIRDNLKVRGGDPSYDFQANRPIFIWDDRGNVSVRYVQSTVFDQGMERLVDLRPIPSMAEMESLIRAGKPVK